MAVADDPADLIRIVADPVRLALLGRAVEGRVSIDEVSDSLNLPKKRVAEALGKLRAIGLIDDGLQIDQSLLRKAAANLPSPAEADAVITDGPWTTEEKRVLRRFFTGTRLTEIPAARGKRTLVLERLAQEFEPGLRYQEQDVNFTLQLFHPDYASLRRYMVEEDIMTRAQGVYWRTGGRYAIGAEPAE